MATMTVAQCAADWIAQIAADQVATEDYENASANVVIPVCECGANANYFVPYLGARGVYLCDGCDAKRPRTVRELLCLSDYEDAAPKTLALIAERDALLARDSDVERLALGLFQTDVCVREHVRRVSDYAFQTPGFRTVYDDSRWWHAMFVAWCRDESGWRTVATCRAADIQQAWGK